MPWKAGTVGYKAQRGQGGHVGGEHGVCRGDEDVRAPARPGAAGWQGRWGRWCRRGTGVTGRALGSRAWHRAQLRRLQFPVRKVGTSPS